MGPVLDEKYYKPDLFWPGVWIYQGKVVEKDILHNKTMLVDACQIQQATHPVFLESLCVQRSPFLDTLEQNSIQLDCKGPTPCPGSN